MSATVLRRASLRRAVFLDRDGVLVEDRGVEYATRAGPLMPNVVEALTRISAMGFVLVVVTNQTAVARGLISLDELGELHRRLSNDIVALGGPRIAGFWVCPHHPHADLQAYKIACECRKPEPGLILRASEVLRLDPGRSWLIGDRRTDIAAGKRAGCRTISVISSQSMAPPIVGGEFVDLDGVPDFACRTLLDAATSIESVA